MVIVVDRNGRRTRSVLLTCALAGVLAACGAGEPGLSSTDGSDPTSAGSDGVTEPAGAGTGTGAASEPGADPSATDTTDPADPSVPAPERLVLTDQDDGGTFRLAANGSVTLRLSTPTSWDTPTVTGAAMEVSPVDYESDPGWREWELSARGSGTATVSSRGERCAKDGTCTDVSFRVTIELVG